MKLDLEYIKQFLEELEGSDTFLVDFNLSREDENEDKRLCHLFVMGDSRLIEFSHTFDAGKTFCVINDLRITYAGYQFLEASRDSKIWQKIKVLSVPVAVELAKTLAVEGGKIVLGIR